MKIVISLLVTILVTTSAFAQVDTYRCEPSDTISIVNDGEYKAIVNFYNSINKCSKEMQVELTANNSIKVKITIHLTGKEYDYSEQIIVSPITPMYEAFPKESFVIDGETKSIIIEGALY